jgi:hypothetical protein
MSCKQNSFEKNLNGKWYALENDAVTRFYFYPDSLVLMELNIQKLSWTANDTKIEFNYVEDWPYNSSENDTIKRVLNYFLSKNGSELLLKLKDSASNQRFQMIKAESYFDFLSKKNGVPFNLPKDNNSDYITLDNRYGLKFFARTTNKKTLITSEYGNELDSITNDFTNFKQTLNPTIGSNDQKLTSEIHFKVFADRSVSDEEIEKLFRKAGIHKKVYRIYESDSYFNYMNLKGKLLIVQ